MKSRIRFYRTIYKKFGVRALFFLLKSKFKVHKTAPWHIRGIKHPVTLSNFNYDVTTLLQIFFAREYDIAVKTIPHAIIDCGANIGLSAVYFANKYPSAKIIAIEPDAENFKFLLKNTRLYSNITCLQKAVWPHAEKLKIVNPGTANWGLQTKKSAIESLNTIDTIGINEITNQYGIDTIDLIKIDIEGAERELFSSNFESWLSRTRVMAIELHDFIDPAISPIFYKAINLYSFRNYQLGENLIFEQDIFDK